MRPFLVLVLLCVLHTASSFVLPRHDATLTQLASDAVFHEDHWVPEDVRAKRSKKIRDKLLGDMEARFVPDGDCPLLAAQKKEDAKKRRSQRDAGHPLLAQMIRLFDQHVVQTETVDPNA